MINIIHKKIFWMNIGLSIFSFLIFVMFFGINIDYVEAKLWMKLLNVLILLTPILSAITFYKNNTHILCVLALISNILILLAFLALIVMSALHYSSDSIVFLLIWSIPLFLNVKCLNKLKNIRWKTKFLLPSI
jgi:hypothetical protein